MDIGYIALFLAAAAALYSAFAFVIGYRGRNEALLQSARNGLIAVFALTSVSVAVLLYGILTHDFSNAYIASYTSTDMSLPYLVSALWAGNDGSLLFWAWLVTLFAVISLLVNRNKARELVPYSSAVMMVIAAFFVIVVITAANPFDTLAVGYATSPHLITCELLPIVIRSLPDDRAIAAGEPEIPEKPYLLVAANIRSTSHARYCYDTTDAFKTDLMARLLRSPVAAQ